MKYFLNILLPVILLATSGQLLASDFIFEVPVKVDRIPKGIPQAKIECNVFGYRDSTQPIATGYSIRPLGSHRGELIDTVQVNVNYKPMKRQISPHRYQCRLMLLIPWAQPAWQRPTSDTSDTSIAPLAGTDPVTLVEGIISSE